MNYINNRLQNELLSAIALYKKERKVIPKQRATDIAYLEKLINSATMTHELINDVNCYIDTMKTGKWIFRTGRSKLKRNIKAVLMKPTPLYWLSEDIEFLLLQLSSHTDYKREKSPEIKQGEPQELSNKYYLVCAEKERYKKENSVLQKENETLRTAAARFEMLLSKTESPPGTPDEKYSEHFAANDLPKGYAF